MIISMKSLLWGEFQECFWVEAACISSTSWLWWRSMESSTTRPKNLSMKIYRKSSKTAKVTLSLQKLFSTSKTVWFSKIINFPALWIFLHSLIILSLFNIELRIEDWSFWCGYLKNSIFRKGNSLQNSSCNDLSVRRSFIINCNASFNWI